MLKRPYAWCRVILFAGALFSCRGASGQEQPVDVFPGLGPTGELTDIAFEEAGEAVLRGSQRAAPTDRHRELFIRTTTRFDTRGAICR